MPASFELLQLVDYHEIRHEEENETKSRRVALCHVSVV
jgi:hypothetical protein